ncbi:MAG: hypothetical protein FJ294_06620 [Planctomycetes bacterium]|nr:hypothetical protein [Planctomycetota bacterium]
MNLSLLLSVQAAATDVAKEAPKIQPMQPLGWAFLLVSVSFVVILTGWCFYKVLTAPPAQ